MAVVRIPGFHCHDPGSVVSLGTEILQALQCCQKKRKKNVKNVCMCITESLCCAIEINFENQLCFNKK